MITLTASGWVYLWWGDTTQSTLCSSELLCFGEPKQTKRGGSPQTKRDSGLGNVCSHQFCWMSILEASAHKTPSNRVKHEFWSQSPWVCILDLPLSRCCVTLGKSLLLSVSLFTHLQNRGDDSAYLVGKVRLYKCLLLFPASCGDCYWGKFLSSCHVPRSRVITGTHQNWKQFYWLSTP